MVAQEPGTGGDRVLASPHLSLEEGVLINLDKFYRRQVRRFAEQLRRTADEIERDAEVRRNIRDLRPDYIEGLSSIMHKLQTLWANLPFDTLASAASEAHVYARTEGQGT